MPSIWWVFAIVILGVATFPIAHARQAVPRTIHVEGHVVDALTGRPVRGVVVLATMLPTTTVGPSAAFLTGDDGRFVFRDLPGNSVGLSASKTGYLHGESSPLALQVGGRRQGIRMPLTPEGVISGRIVDQFGEPVGRASVRAVPPGEAPGERPAAEEPTRTDDTGRYVIGGLGRGQYLVTAEAASVSATVVYESVFYPAARTAADATAIEIESGVEKPGVDMTVTLVGNAPGSSWKELHSDAPDAGILAGFVRDVSGRGLAYTTVQMRRAEGATALRQTNTDGDGRFQFEGVPPGRFTVGTSRPGYRAPLDAAPGQRSWRTIEVRPGQRDTGLAFVLAKSATVSGRLLDQFGDPMTGSVALTIPGGLELPMYGTQTNARGEFRILNVDDGVYVLSVGDKPFGRDLRMSVSDDHEQTVAMLRLYHPGVTDASLGARLTVSAGTDVSGITIVARPQPVSVIDVEVDADGRTTRDVTIERVVVRPVAPETAKRSPDGSRWWLESTPAGRHEVVASALEVSAAGPRAGARLWASAEVTTDGTTPASLSLVLRPGARMSGTIVHEGVVPTAPVRVSLQSADGRRLRIAAPTQEIGPVTAGTRPFTLTNIEPGKYVLIAIDMKQTSTLKSVVIDGPDVHDRPIDLGAGTNITNVVITLTDQVTQVSGTVQFDPVAHPEVVVMAFPADPQLWGFGLLDMRLSSALVDPSGRYTMRGLLPGDYRIAALTARDLSGTDGRTGLFKKLWPSSALVSLKLGETRIQDLTVK